MLLSLLVASVLQSPAAPTEFPTAGWTLYVKGESGWQPLTSAVDSRFVPLPLASRSELQPRPSLEHGRIQVRLWTAERRMSGFHVRLHAIEHSSDESVVRDPSGTVWRLGPKRLPSSARTHDTGIDVLPALARIDGNSVVGLLDLDFGRAIDGERVVISGVPLGDDFAGSRAANAHAVIGRADYRLAAPLYPFEVSVFDVPVDGACSVEIRGSAGLDQISARKAERVDVGKLAILRIAEVTAVLGRELGRHDTPYGGPNWPLVEPAPDAEESALQVLDQFPEIAPGCIVDLSFDAPPPAAEGRTITLLLDLDGAWLVGASEPRRPQQRRSGMFPDVAHDVGIDMVHFEGPDLQLDIRPTMGPGAAWGDVDGDGWVDLFLPQGGGREGSALPTSRFYRNVDGKRFVDESAARGLAHTGAGMAALFYDADGDGDLDLIALNYGRNRFLLNAGKGHFTDASDAVGLDTNLWHAAVSAADFDGDGDLDLFVTSYLNYDTSQMPSDEELGRYQREDPVEMLPFAFPGERKLLLRCDLTPGKDGAPATIRYVDVAKELGLDDPNGRGMQALWWDFDRDGDQDLYLANDVSPNRFWRNEGGGKLKDVGFSTGLDDPRGCMGLAVGDIDGDLDEDLFVTNWQLESNALYVNNLRHTSAKSRVSTFRDRAVEAGLGQLSVGVTGWGCELADFDLDGDLDLFYANGYTSPDYESTGICVGQPCHYFENDGAGHFDAAFEKAGPDVAIPLASRAAIACDFDQDGDLDLAITANNGRFRLLRNDAVRGKNHWLGVRLKGTNGNTHAIGAQVVVEAGERKLLRSLRAGTGYLSGNAPELHFGLGEATSVSACTVRWPSGKETTHVIDGVDRYLTIAEPK